jgi:hypothetical protein
MGNKKEDQDVILTIVETPNQPSKSIAFPTSASSEYIAAKTTELSGARLEPKYYEQLKRTVNRGWLHGELELNLTDWTIRFKRQPRKEVERTEKVIWVAPEEPKK